LPKLDFAAPLSLGVAAEREIATVDFLEDIDPPVFITAMNASMPQDVRIHEAEVFKILEGIKKVSAASVLWGFSYRFDEQVFEVEASEDKKFRERMRRPDDERIPSGLVRCRVWAKDGEQGSMDYFKKYSNIYTC
jgi:uncharacterized protein (DUF2344 family)